MPSPLRIRFLKYAAGPNFGPFQPGEETELPYDRARVLIDSEAAERLGTVEPEREEPAPVERAVLRQPETALGPPQREERSSVLEESPAEEVSPEVEEPALEEDPTAEESDPDFEAGRQAALEGQPRASNPNDGRTAPGRAWLRGYDVVGTDDVA